VTTIGRTLPNVFIIDDEALVRMFVRDALQSMARVEEAADGEAALETLKARGGTTDLVLADQVLPRRSGLEVLRTIKGFWPWIPVVILTGFGSEHLAIEALRAGASDYLRKPVALNALLRTVTRLLTIIGAHVSEEAPPTESQGSGPRRAHPSLRRALVFMAQHFMEAITLADAAREAGLSRFHFCRLFHQEVGVTFHEHLHDLRVCRAKTLLADRHLRISEVAYSVGFNDLSHFDRTFRRMVGRSPSEYRASLLCA
jgi:YesN/AraC family two-component response regulator